MPAVTIRHVPDEARDALAARARSRGQSLQEYLLGLLVRESERPDTQEWVREARALSRQAGLHLGADGVVGLVHAGRADDE
jgi:hypothetical protein